MSNCNFKLPEIPIPGLSLDLPSLPALPDFDIAIPGFPLRLQLPEFAFALSLELPSLPALPDFAVSIPGFPLNLQLPDLPIPGLSLSLPELPSLPDFGIVCPLD